MKRSLVTVNREAGDNREGRRRTLAKAGQAFAVTLAVVLSFGMLLISGLAEESYAGISVYDGAIYEDDVLMSWPKGRTAETVQVRADCSAIASGAFAGSGTIGKVVIPDSCVIRPGAFVASGVGALEVSGRNTSIYYKDGVIFSADRKELLTYLVGKKDAVYQVPDQVERIASQAFMGNAYVKKISMGSGVTAIGAYAFRDCTSLEKIRLPEAIDFSGSLSPDGTRFTGLFKNCSSLQELELPEGIKRIDSEMLSGCKALQRLVIPESAETIAACAFHTGGSIHELVVYSRKLQPAQTAGADGEPVIDWTRCLPENPGAWSVQPNEEHQPNDGDITYVYAYPDSEIAAYLTDPSRINAQETESYTSVYRDIQGRAEDQPDHGTCGDGVSWQASGDGKTLTITCSASGTGQMDHYVLKSVTDAPWMWRYGDSIENVVIGEGVTSVGEFDFYGMPKLKTITWPGTLTEVHRWAFGNCDSLTAVAIPARISNLRHHAFSYCDKLKSITFRGGAGTIYESFSGCTALQEVTFGAAVNRIEDFAFAGCSALKSLDLSNARELRSYICPRCPNLKKIYLSKVQTILDYTFGGVTANVYYTDSVPKALIGGSYGGSLQWFPIGDDTGEEPGENADPADEDEAPAKAGASALPLTQLAQRCNGDYGYQYIKKELHDETMQALYEAIDAAEEEFFLGAQDITAESGQLTVECGGLTEHQIRQVYSTYRNDHPLYFWMAEHPRIVGSTAELTCEKSYLAASAREHVLQAMTKEMDRYEAYCEGSASRYTYAASIVYRMVQKTTFTETGSGSSASATLLNSAAAVLDPSCRRAAGQGYARAYQLLLNYFDVPNVLVHGKAGVSGTEHAWNLVQMEDGKFYRVDPAYCDVDLSWDYGEYGVGDGYAPEAIEKMDNVKDNPRRMNYEFFLRGETFDGDHTICGPEDSDLASLCMMPAAAEKDYVPEIPGIRSILEVKKTVNYTGPSDEWVCNGEEDPFKYIVVQNDGLHRQVEIQDRHSSTAENLVIPAKITLQGLTYDVAGVNLNCAMPFVKTLEIEEGVRYVMGMINYDSSAVRSIRIPSTVEYLEIPFLSMVCLEEIRVAEDNPYITSEDGVLYNKAKTTLIRYPADRADEEFTVPASVSNIYHDAFGWNEYLKSIHMGDGVKYINVYSFGRMKSMTEMTIPSSVDLLPGKVFCENMVMQTVHIYETTSFTMQTFMDSSALPDILKIGQDPTGPTDPTNPSDPTDPTGPSDPTDPTDPTNPSDPTDPANPTDYTDPTNPTDPTDPTNPSDPTGPAGGGQVPAKQQIDGADKYTKAIGCSFTPKVSAQTELSYRSSNPAIASVSKTGKVTVKGYGTCTITITAKATAEYEQAVKQIRITAQLAKPTLKGSNKSGKRIKLSWSKVEGASGYQLYVKFPGKKKYQLAVTKSARVKSVTHRGLQKGKKYSYKSRAFIKVGKKTCYGPWSKEITVKVRK